MGKKNKQRRVESERPLNPIDFDEQIKEDTEEIIGKLPRKRRNEVKKADRRERDILDARARDKARRLMPNVEARAEAIGRALRGKKAYVFYLYDPVHRNLEMKPVSGGKFLWRSKRTGELFYLVNIAFMLEGAPVFLCVRNIPISIDLEIDPPAELKAMFALWANPASIEAKLRSMYLQYLTKRQEFTAKVTLALVAALGVGILIGSFAMYVYFNPAQQHSQNTNSTVSTLTLAWNLLKGAFIRG